LAITVSSMAANGANPLRRGSRHSSAKR